MIKVPSIIRRFLIHNYQMHNIPIGSQDVMDNMQNLPKDIGFFFAGKNCFLNFCIYILLSNFINLI